MIEKFRSGYQKISTYLNDGQERSVKAKKNILGALLIKGTSIMISLAMVPLTIDYVNPSRYGIWLTLSSIVGWFAFFDIGLTQGLRNKFAEALTDGNKEQARIYVSTTYATLTLIFFLVWIVFLVTNSFLDWTAILKVDSAMVSELSILVVIVFTYFCLQFILKTVTSILTADQQPAQASLIELIGQFISLLSIIFLVVFTEGSLINLGLALCISPIVVLLFANLILFKGKYRDFRPSMAKVDFKHAKSLFQLGGKFFVIQIASIVQYESANIIIARNFSTTDVTAFNVVHRYFGVLNMAFAIFLTPFWSASTEAFLRKDFQWIKSSIKKYNKLNLLLFFVGLVMLYFAQDIYDLWLGQGTIQIDFQLSMWGFIFFILFVFGSKYVSFLNGISALRIQFWSSMFSPILYILIAITLIGPFQMGVSALFIAAIFANVNGVVLAPLQYYMVVDRKKQGVWLK
ncbi:Na+-driven multidrug efflux pump [Belliella buryatensis]|uniref:Na+-driven multidrug efflux pump n=1 Tax=Belliella buryatensis TaxID=1500549 RepID=A0A239BHT2_9BACT|nr:MATE family efflux transporter [Belliella buryatensis]SNS07675.1 Na+-driven multidrug efflux pump [Belliella buryatensis]